jgi:DNA primase
VADFGEIKEKVSIEQVAAALGLDSVKSNGQFRAPCRACGTGGPRALVVTPHKGLWYCFSAGVGGDLISLWGHVEKCSLAEAGRHIANNFGIGNVTGRTGPTGQTSPTVNSPEAAPEKGHLKPLDYLEADHAAVEAVGFAPKTAQQLGIGYAPKGILRGTVAIPVRLEDGTLAGYVGITEAKLPKEWHGIATNVVPITRKTA